MLACVDACGDNSDSSIPVCVCVGHVGVYMHAYVFVCLRTSYAVLMMSFEVRACLDFSPVM